MRAQMCKYMTSRILSSVSLDAKFMLTMLLLDNEESKTSQFLIFVWDTWMSCLLSSRSLVQLIPTIMAQVQLGYAKSGH